MIAPTTPVIEGACPQCATPVAADEQFCESCGAALTDSATASDPASRPGASAEPAQPAESAPGLGSTRTRLTIPAPSEPEPELAAVGVRHCASCAAVIDPDGYCTVCGAKAAAERDHFRETPSAWTGGVCDRGIRHYRNEDAMASVANSAPGSFAALVVCDGVSNSVDSDRASLNAARAARDVLSAAHATRPEESDAVAFWTEQIGLAADAAQAEARAVATDAETVNPPSCTFVTAVLDGATIVAGCVGDSRAYWLPDDGPAAQLTADDSWASEQIRAGMPRAVAEADSRAHAITRWLGIDSPDSKAACVATTATEPGWLLVCSDGLWNYCSEATELRALIHRLAQSHESPVAICAALVDFANAAGGSDNITSVLARVEGAPTPAR
ncbi:MAG TPA: protein phosphatase 2C domain-containing protein [Mycobacteriales bacterium]|nr:protein phosphatase 2C domain-containing protein [Mycobacteriales bacterium]